MANNWRLTDRLKSFLWNLLRLWVWCDANDTQNRKFRNIPPKIKGKRWAFKQFTWFRSSILSDFMRNINRPSYCAFSLVEIQIYLLNKMYLPAGLCHQLNYCIFKHMSVVLKLHLHFVYFIKFTVIRRVYWINHENAILAAHIFKLICCIIAKPKTAYKLHSHGKCAIANERARARASSVMVSLL